MAIENYKYQLLENGFSKDDIFKGIEVLKTQKIPWEKKNSCI